MYKRIISLLVLPLTLGTTEVCAQNFLNNLKKKGRQKTEQVINEVFEGEKKEAAAPSPKSSQQVSAASVSRQSTSLTPPPSVSMALFEPLGYPTGKGTFEGPVTLPEEVSRFDRGQFQECTSLKSVTLPGNLKDVRLLARLFSGSGIIRPDATAIPDGLHFVD